MASDERIALLLEQYEQVKASFEQFWRVRRDQYDRLVRRELKIELDPDLEKYGNVDIQSPVLEQALQDHVAVMMIDQTKIDMVALEEGVQAEKDAEKLRIVAASSQRRQNQGRWRDLHVYHSMARYGVAIVRKDWRRPPEPDLRAPPDTIAEIIDWASEALELRGHHFRILDEHAFSETGRSPLTCCWGGRGLENPDIFFEEAQIPYLDAVALGAKHGKREQVEALLQRVTLGAPQPVDENQDVVLAQQWRASLRILRRDWLNPETGKRTITEYVYAEGYDRDGKVLREYANPLGRCSYYVIAGSLVPTETGPHQRYIPGLMYGLYTHVYTYNWLTSVIAALGRKAISDKRLYVKLASLRPEVLDRLQGLGYRAEGGGVEGEGLVWRMPDGASDELAAFPELAEYPTNLIEPLTLMLAETKEGIAQARPNRFLVGDAPDVVATSSASAYLDAKQSTAVPYHPYLTAYDEFQRQDVEAEIHAYLEWDQEGPPVEVAVLTTGDEPLLKGSADPGKTIVVTTDALKRRYQVAVKTRNQTVAEKAQEDAMAWSDYQQGTITFPQLLRRKGHEDPQRQVRELNVERHKVAAAQQLAPIEAKERLALIEALTGLDLAAEMGATSAVPPGANGAVPQNTDVARPLAPATTPAFSPVPAGARPTFTAPAVQGIEGGDSSLPPLG